MSLRIELPHNIISPLVKALVNHRGFQYSALSLAALVYYLCVKFPQIAPPLIRSTLLSFYSASVRNIVIAAVVCTLSAKKALGKNFKGSYFPIFFLLCWSLFYRFKVVENPIIKFQRTFWNVHICERSQISKKKFKPVPWAWNRHAQTITCFMVSQLEHLWTPSIQFHREEIVSTVDGNTLFIDWAYHKHDEDHKWTHSKSTPSVLPELHSCDTPVIVAIHGLGDDRNHPYIQRLAHVCSQCGWRLAVHSYWRFDFIDSQDLKQVIDHISNRNPKAPIIAVGYSAGGHHLLKYLQDVGKDTPVVASIAVSACFDFVQAVHDVESNENKTYRLFLDAQTRICARRHLDHDKTIQHKRHVFEDIISEYGGHCLQLFDRFIYELIRTRQETEGTVSEEEGEYEFMKQTKDYYKFSASANMNKIEVATLLLHAADDPVVSIRSIDWNAFTDNKNIFLFLTKRGGHVAWYEGFLPFGETLADRVIADFTSAVLDSHSHTNFVMNVVTSGLTLQGKVGLIRPSSIARICSNSNTNIYGLGTDKDGSEDVLGTEKENEKEKKSLSKIRSQPY